jgi:hypothetical protein
MGNRQRGFSRGPPYGSHVWITRYWEIESYLIEPSVIEAYVSHRDGGRAQRPQAEAEFMCLTHAEALIPHAAFKRCETEAWGTSMRRWPDVEFSSRRS